MSGPSRAILALVVLVVLVLVASSASLASAGVRAAFPLDPSPVEWRVGHGLATGARLDSAVARAIARADFALRSIAAPGAYEPFAERMFAAFPGSCPVADGRFRERATTLEALLAGGSFRLAIRIVPWESLGGAMAGFAARGPDGRATILLNAGFVAGEAAFPYPDASDAELARLLLEELGHAFDSFLNGEDDTPGDEGERFAAETLGCTIEPMQAARMAREDDRRRVTVDGVELSIEEASITFVTVYRATLGPGGQSIRPDAPLAGTSFRFTTSPPSASSFQTARQSGRVPGTFTYLDAGGQPVTHAGEVVTRTPTGSTQATAVGFRNASPGGPDFVFMFGGSTLTLGVTVNSSANHIASLMDEYVEAEGPSGLESSWSAEPTVITADGVSASIVSVTVRDADGDPLEGATVTLGIVGGTADIAAPNPATSGGDGRVSFAVTSTVVNTVTLQVSVSRGGVETTLANPATIELSFVPGPAERLAVIQQPTAGDSGVAFAIPFRVQVEDGSGHPVTTDGTSEVTAEIASGPAGATLGGTLSRIVSGGIATFDDLAITGPGGVYVIRFTSDGLGSADTENVVLCNLASYWLDADGDGFGDATRAPMSSCAPLPGTVTNEADCDDVNPSVNPAALEVCDDLDNDCSGLADDGLSFANYWPDADGDGFGDATRTPVSSCIPLPGTVTNGADCDDVNPSINPDAPEICDGEDNDCSGLADDGLSFENYWPDADGDGFGDASSAPTSSCREVPEAVTNDGDCNDLNGGVNPAALEVCDDLDNDCSGFADDGLSFENYWPDADGDGFGDATRTPMSSCAPLPGTVTNGADCDDVNPSINPDAPEICDGEDNDCSGLADDGLSFENYWPDADGDGFGDATATPILACTAPPGRVADASDLCDGDPAMIAPGACGCGNPDTDSDADTVADCIDNCPEVANSGQADANANGTGDACESDSDGDGVDDSLDGCPNDPNKTSPGICGCGVVEEDLDVNWFLDCLENLVPPLEEVLPSVDIAAGDEFGAAIGVHGSLVAIGMPGADHLGVSDCGSVRLFRWNGTSLEEEARLHPPVPTANERFGMAVAVYGSTVAVGVPLASVGGELEAGKVFIFRHLGGGSWAADVEFTRPGAAAGDRFGTSVTLRGGFLAVGAPQADPAGAADAGEVCVFRVDGGTTEPTVTLSGMPLSAGDRAGQGVALGGDPRSPSLLIGVPGDDDNGAADSGAVYLHGLDAGGGATLRARLVGAPVSGRGLGSAVAMSGNGQTLAASAPLADVAAGVDAGLALAWRFNGSGWLMSSLLPPSHAAGERFGSSLAMDENGGVLVVGSPASVGSGIAQRGRATSFQRRGEASWDGGARLEDGLGGPSASRFGAAVGVIDTKPLVGGPFHTPPAGGAVLRFGFVRDCLGNDSDADGMGDACDGCPGDHSKIWGEQCGCGNLETDGDSDGTSDCRDDCPGDPGKTGPGACGCGIADMDSDSDGIADCLDADDDNDGIDDTSDGCPFDAAKSSPGLCGCGTPDADGDGDGTPDCLDGCEADAAKTAPGLCGCGVADVDSDGDELVDCLGGGVLAENATPAGPALASGDDYGWSVSTDGDIAVVGMPGEDLAGGKTDAGAAVVLVRTAGVWSVQATLTATDSRKQDRFGGAVALSGDLIVVGAPLADVSGIKDAGAAYVFRRAGSGWSQEVKFTRPLAAASDRFGDAVAVRGDFVAVGAPQANAGGLNDSGVVSVFEFESLVWSPRSNLTGVPVTAGDRFGQSVAFGGSAATPVLAVGATGDDQGSQTNCGAVYVMALDADGVAVATVRLLEVTPQKNAGLGASVSVDDAGTTVAAGAPLANVTGAGLKSGEVTVWTESGTWSATTVVPPDHSSNDQFGTSVALNNAGDALVVGSPFDTVVGVAGRGSATVFSLSSGSWRIYDRLTLPAVGATASQFGRSAAFAGGPILIGGPKHDGRGTLREFAGVP